MQTINISVEPLITVDENKRIKIQYPVIQTFTKEPHIVNAQAVVLSPEELEKRAKSVKEYMEENNNDNTDVQS